MAGFFSVVAANNLTNSSNRRRRTFGLFYASQIAHSRHALSTSESNYSKFPRENRQNENGNSLSAFNSIYIAAKEPTE